MPIDEKKLKELFQNRNSITFDQFCQIMQDFGQYSHDAYFHETFRAFDRNSDGYITAKEIKKTMKDLGETLTDKQAKDMLKTADSDGDGKLSRDEFRTLFTYITQQAATPPISPQAATPPISPQPSTPNSQNKRRFSNPFKPQTE
jgi:Ca2+-binding EF-hand superfamily protein